MRLQCSKISEANIAHVAVQCLHVRSEVGVVIVVVLEHVMVRPGGAWASAYDYITLKQSVI